MNHGGIRRPVNRDGRYTKIMTVLWRNSSPEKTTDDCYTPQPVYDAVLGWLRENADIEGREIVRPFWPGGDYEHYDYPDGCVVVDNPPFSIFTQVCRFFQSRNISFFSVRAASDVAQSGRHELDRHSVRRSGDIRKQGMRRYVVCQQPFGDIRIMTAPDLLARIKNAAKTKRRLMDLPKYIYPDNVVSAALLGKYPLTSNSRCGRQNVEGSANSITRKGEVFMEADISLSDKATARKNRGLRTGGEAKTDYHRIGITRNPARTDVFAGAMPGRGTIKTI